MRRVHLLVYLTCLLALIPVLLTSCESPSDTTPVKLDSTVVGAKDRALFILNEGQYSKSDGSLDIVIYRANGDTVIDHQVLSGLGVGNAVHVFGNLAYVIDNASNQIVKLSADSLKKVGSLSFGLDNPNEMVMIGPDRALVTLLYSTHADIVDLAKMQIVDTIGLGEGSNTAAVLHGKAYITTGEYGGGSHVQIYDLTQKRFVRSLPLIAGAGPIVADSAHDVVVVGAVGMFDSTTARVYWLNPTTDEITDSTDTQSKSASLTFIQGGDRLFALDGGSVVRVDQMQHSITPLAIAGYFYNGAYDAKTDQLFLGHNDFSGNPGLFEVFGATDLKRHWSETAGIAPAHFAFYH